VKVLVRFSKFREFFLKIFSKTAFPAKKRGNNLMVRLDTPNIEICK